MDWREASVGGASTLRVDEDFYVESRAVEDVTVRGAEPSPSP